MKSPFKIGLMLLAFSTIGLAQAPLENVQAYAQRGNRLLVLGSTMDTDKTAGKTKSHSNQIIELDTGKRQALPALPVSVSITQAAWLNDDSAIVFARVKNDSGSPESIWLGKLNTKTNRFNALPAFSALSATYSEQDGRNLTTKLIGVSNDTAWFIADDGRFTGVSMKPDVQPSAANSFPALLRKRANFVGRALRDGRVVVAGGEVESEMVLTRERGCGAPPAPPCVEKYTGYGQRLPSRRHEMFDPVTTTWRNSAPSRASGGSATILPSGRVAKVGNFTTTAADPNDPKRKIETTTALLEIAAEDGQSWRRIVLPAPLASLSSSYGLDLIAVTQANGLLDRGLFLRATAGDGRADNTTLGSPKDPVWWWLADVDDPRPTWQLLNRERSLGITANTAGATKTTLHVWPTMAGVAVYAK